MPKQLLQNFIVKTLDDLKAIDVTLLDVHKETTITDFMIICTGKSSRQLKATADHLIAKLREKEVKPFGIEGQNETGWVLIDFGYIIVHIMTPEMRDFYSLEKIWS